MIPFGRYSRGGLILWEAKTVVELETGDILFFPDHFLLHSNEPVEGIRHSMVAFSHQQVFDFFSEKQKAKSKGKKSSWKQEKHRYEKREKVRARNVRENVLNRMRVAK